MERRIGRFDIVSLAIAATMAVACQASTPTSTPTSVPTSGQTNPPSPVASVAPSTGPSSPTVVVTIKAIPGKRWGDDPFKVSAKATGGKPVSYAATGGCTVNAKSGSVTIKSIGSCTITARTTGASDSATFKIDRGRPEITFGNRNTLFRRALNYDLKATVSLPLPLAYKVIHGAAGTSNDAYCDVKDGHLVWTKTPTADKHPSMPAACMVRVSAAQTSKNYVTPASVQRLVHIGYPTWKVHADSQSVSFASIAQPDGSHRFTVMVSENTGDALGMLLYVQSGPCTPDFFSTPKVTRLYKFDVLVSSTGACNFSAQAQPQDWDGFGKGSAFANFTITFE